MAYIQLHQTVHSHRKTLEAAKLLSIDRFTLVGHLTALWCWALDSAPDGVLPRDAAFVAHAAGWMKNPVLFAGVLAQVGFLDAGPDGEWIIHDWYEYAGRLIEHRMKNKERMRVARSKQQANK